MEAGTRLGPYEIRARIGAGGMGEVWQATDTRLGRSVAVKLLPPEYSTNSQLRMRLEREGRAISQLNHPNICTLYDVGENYLVMELLDGETLADRLSRGPLPVVEAVSIGIQVAGALDRAHRAGIVHRDLKPGNIMLTSAGVKLLDFGLARVTGPASDPGAATMQKSITEEGTLVGTLLYMAPEQLEGREADARTDLFALGAVLYEMVAGRRAFDSATRASAIARILGSEPPPLRTASALTPPALERIVRRCLAKNPMFRWQCAGDVRRELELLEEEPEAAAPRRTSRALAIAAAALALVAVAEGVWLLRKSKPASAGHTVRFLVEPPPNTLIRSANESGAPALSPDGTLLAFVAMHDISTRRMLYVRQLASTEARPVPGTDGAGFPFWSPDGRSIGFFAGGKLKRVQPDGTALTTIADAAFGRGASWGPDGTIIFSRDTFGPLFRVPAAGGPVQQVTRLDAATGESSHRWPFFLPGGRHLLMFSRSLASNPERTDTIFVVDLRTGGKKALTPTSNMAVFANGSVYYVRDRTLFARRLNLDTLQLEGDPVPVAENLQVHGSGHAMFSVSGTGVLCYQTGSVASELRWVDRRGLTVATYGDPAEYSMPTLEPDSGQFLVARADPLTGSLDLWRYDMERNVPRRMTFDASDDWCPTVSPDGALLAFTSNRSNYPQIYIRRLEGAQPERQIEPTIAARWPVSWSPDGRYIAHKQIAGQTKTDIQILDLKEGRSRPLLASPFNEAEAAFSPSGRWLAYVSDESGRPEVYVTSFPEASGRWQISSGGASQPRWRADEKELFYYGDGAIFAVPVDGRQTFKAGLPQRLFAGELRPTREDLREYDVSPDGQHFLVNTSAGRRRSLPLTVAVGASPLVK